VVELRDDLAVVQAKIAQYRDLIARGVDCEDDIPDGVAAQLGGDELLTGTLPSVLLRHR